MACWFNIHFYLFPLILSLLHLKVVFSEDVSSLECYAVLIGI